ncbi:FKBP-type peptidyl-prolyl cis-trans isomerase [Allorhodopirellula solitaria]|uniref:Peptidyl-prolyl cis-trans isomerase n=1 Tax=Allorhodopirellula solitaria TaxID=2527987 RepID=A0A5C5YIX5_9BACT|nr:FKBP-type peptidyl-prolyl cis-trans isomerase [Allorhodopirellula solitaria]TWT74828.1 FK506-binding protein [Allorhodopirellula solitaria]
MRAGLKVDQETVGDGATAEQGDRVTVRLEIRLNRGELVQSLDDYSFVLGKRDVIAAVEYGVEGMRVGGHRNFRAGPHLCYRSDGVPGVIPADAVLCLDIRLLKCERI